MIRHNGIEVERSRRGFIVRYCKRVETFERYAEKRLMHALILGGGLTRDCLFDLMYGHDPDGGPLKGRNLIDVRLAQWKPRLEKMGLKIHREKRGGKMHLEIVPDVV